MAARGYTASLSRSQGREGWSIIFRHPARLEEATGKPGRRVRRGLGTNDQAEAEKLRDQLNVILADPRFHDAAAKADAENKFDGRVVEIFYDEMVPEEFDYAAIRSDALPLPEPDEDYRRVLLLGTTGAGKTTLVRQLIGSDPLKERFPSTSTAKTTVHDSEIILTQRPWQAVVTFVASKEVREYLLECVSAAVLAAWRHASDDEVLRRLLAHVNQRFRFNYVLGNGPYPVTSDFDEEEDDEDDDSGKWDARLFTTEDVAEIDLEKTNDILKRAVTQLRGIAQ